MPITLNLFSPRRKSKCKTKLIWSSRLWIKTKTPTSQIIIRNRTRPTNALECKIMISSCIHTHPHLSVWTRKSLKKQTIRIQTSFNITRAVSLNIYLRKKLHIFFINVTSKFRKNKTFPPKCSLACISNKWISHISKI